MLFVSCATSRVLPFIPIAVGVSAGTLHAEQVRVGAGCDLDMDQVAEVLTAGTDSICVHSIGYTLTVYRYIGGAMRRTVQCSFSACMGWRLLVLQPRRSPWR